MNNKAHLRPKDFDSNGDIIPMACKEEKGDFISREALKKAINSLYKYDSYTDEFDTAIKTVFGIIDNAPTVEPTENSAIQYSLGYQDGFLEGKKLNEKPQGEWIGGMKCSVCGDFSSDNGKFCTNCGAKMKEGAE